MESSLTSGLIALLLAFALGFGAAWVWRSKRIDVLQGLATRLRRERRTLAHRLSQSNGRLDSANYNRKKTEDNLVRLQTTHDALESDHAKLVVNYANLKSGNGVAPASNFDASDDWFADDNDRPAQPAKPDSTARRPGRRATPTRHSSDQSNADSGSRTGDNESTLSMDDSLMADTLTGPGSSGPSGSFTEQGPGGTTARASDAKDPAMKRTRQTSNPDSIDAGWQDSSGLGPSTVDDYQDEPSELPESELPEIADQHPVADGRSSPTSGDNDIGENTRNQALRDLEAFEAQLSAATRSIGAVGADESFKDAGHLPVADSENGAVREQISRQQAEIDRLQEQLAPLLGLPLALSAREAERDRLSEQLDLRDQSLAQLQRTVEKQGLTELALRDELVRLRDDQKKKNKQDKNKSGKSKPAKPKRAKRDKKAVESARHARLRSEPQAGTRHNGSGASTRTDATDAQDMLVSDALPWQFEHAPATGSGPDHVNGVSASEASGLSGQQSTVHSRTRHLTGSPRQFEKAPPQIDNLKEIHGIGPVLERRLNQLGVFQFRQIAAWSDSDVAYFDSHLQDFRGRIDRDNWVAGAREAEQRRSDG